jgi:hypothetical protein
MNLFELFAELIKWSINEEKGLTLFIKGQTVAGIVVEIIGTEAIVLKSQTYRRIIVRLDSIDGMAAS